MEKAIFNSLNFIIDCLDNGKPLVGIYFDLSRAFDTLDHEILLQKLWWYGIRGVAYDFFKSYLKGRSQTVCIIKNQNSEIRNKRDLMWGSSKIHPRPTTISPICKRVAGDTSCLVAGEVIEETSFKGCQVIKEMKSWCEDNSLSLNENKTSVRQYSIRNNRDH